MTWDLAQIESLLSKHEGWVVHHENDCLCVTNEDGLDAYVAVSGAQILVARAAVAVGVAGIFAETHPDPDKAPSDGPNMIPLHLLRGFLEELIELDRVAKARKNLHWFAE